MLDHRERLAVTDDEVIEHPYLNQIQRFGQALGQAVIGMAGFADAGGMVMADNHYMQSIDRLPLRSKVVTRKFSSHEQFA